jgi:hypothetical protein
MISNAIDAQNEAFHVVLRIGYLRPRAAPEKYFESSDIC